MAGFHFEDVKASIRKRYGSLNAFEQEKGLPRNSVSDWGRGRASRHVKGAILAHLSSSGEQRLLSAMSDNNPKSDPAHQNREKAA